MLPASFYRLLSAQGLLLVRWEIQNRLSVQALDPEVAERFYPDRDRASGRLKRGDDPLAPILREARKLEREERQPWRKREFRPR